MFDVGKLIVVRWSLARVAAADIHHRGVPALGFSASVRGWQVRGARRRGFANLALPY